MFKSGNLLERHVLERGLHLPPNLGRLLRERGLLARKLLERERDQRVLPRVYDIGKLLPHAEDEWKESEICQYIGCKH